MMIESGSLFLNEDKHYPPLDNQGRVRSCMGQSFAYIQMTNAVSRKIDTDAWVPATMPATRFSPRFIYLLARSTPEKIYNFLKDHGCLTVNRCSFPKNEKEQSIELNGNIPMQAATAWNVGIGDFKAALQYRISGYQAVDINDIDRKQLLNKIKNNLNDGNVVIATNHFVNWIQTELTIDCGKYGKKGDVLFVASRRYVPIGHSYAIVGYDDQIEAQFAGITFRGAFLITCGYGSVWMNNGYCWLMYDALFPVSDFDIMNHKNIYSEQNLMTYYYGNLRLFSQVQISDRTKEIQNFIFIPEGQEKIEGQPFVSYRIQNPLNGTYLGITKDEDLQRQVVFAEKNENADVWCLIPYENLVQWPCFKTKYERFYEGAYWLLSIELYKNNPTSRVFLDSGMKYYDVGRTIGVSRFNHGDFPFAKSWRLKNVSKTHRFCSSLAPCEKDENTPKRRTSSFSEFWFVDWKKDVALGLPKLMVDLELETVNRESFEVKMLRYDKEGNMESYIPAMFRINHTRYVEEPDIMSFSGKINAKKPEAGYFTFQYSDLLSVSKGTVLEDYRWGIEVTSKTEHPVTIKSVSLVNAKNEILASIDMENGPLLICNNSKKFIF